MQQERNPAAVLRASRTQPMRIGEWLVRKRVIDRAQLFRALSASQRGAWRLGDVVVALGFAPPALVEAEAEILRMRRCAGVWHGGRMGYAPDGPAPAPAPAPAPCHSLSGL